MGWGYEIYPILRSKNGSFLSIFFPKINEKNIHLLEKEVKESDTQIKNQKSTKGCHKKQMMVLLHYQMVFYQEMLKY